MKDFMIQGGDPLQEMGTWRPGYRFGKELHRFFKS